MFSDYKANQNTKPVTASRDEKDVQGISKTAKERVRREGKERLKTAARQASERESVYERQLWCRRKNR